jgi:hypothetical protein
MISQGGQQRIVQFEVLGGSSRNHSKDNGIA